jgi:ABC-type sugar transport system permease subunit
LKKKFAISPYLFILPSFTLIAVFFYYPVFYALGSSFTDLRLGYEAKFVGLANYKKLLTDVVFFKSLINQLILTITDVVKNLFFPLLAAEILYFIRNKNTEKRMKTLFILPMLVPSLVIILMWKYIYDPSGALNSLLDLCGLGSLKHTWFREIETALGAVIGIGFPFISGLYFLIFHASVSAIPKELNEAANIDGCKSLQLVRFVHIPLVVPYMAVVVILTVINSLQNYVTILVTTNGGPGYATYIPALLMFKVAFDASDIGYASSMGVVLFVTIMGLTLATMKLSKMAKNY